MKAKPDLAIEPEIRRLILEKLVMGRYWGHSHLAQDDVPKGLPKIPNLWYHHVKHKLKREGVLRVYKEHGKDLYALNIERKAEIEQLVGLKNISH